MNVFTNGTVVAGGSQCSSYEPSVSWAVTQNNPELASESILTFGHNYSYTTSAQHKFKNGCVEGSEYFNTILAVDSKCISVGHIQRQKQAFG